MRMRAPAASAAAANARCQKCQQQGHWTYECNQDYLYKSRPTRTQQLLDPKYCPKFMDAREVLPEDHPAQAEPAKAPRKRRRHQSDSSSSDSDSSSSSDSGSSSSSDSDSSSSSDGSTSSGSTSSSGSDSSSSSGSSSSDASSSSGPSSDSQEDKPSRRSHKRLSEYPVRESRHSGMQDLDRQHYSRHERRSDRRTQSASRRATEQHDVEAASYRGDSRRVGYERHRQRERRSVDEHVRPDLERQDTRQRIASKISVPDSYTAARQEPHLHATEISREQPFGDRWNGRYEPSNGSHAHHEERARKSRSRQQHRAASGSSDYTGSSGATGSSTSSGRS
ncbi:hypothetical protein WJX79_010425 [Trebouxia sp. C0005]